MDGLSAIRRWFAGETRYHWVQALGHRGTRYFRYDASHHLHRGIDKLKLARDLVLLLLVAWLILSGLLPVVQAAIPGSSVNIAILAIAAGVLALLSWEGGKDDKS